MKLFFQKIGKGPAFIILHGLYGSSDNWISIAKKLSDKYTVYMVDQRNHGRSAHDNAHTYQLMCDDLNEFIKDHNLIKPEIMGHSMGGKTAILYAATYPENISRLIVIDTALAGYASLNEYSPQALQHLNIIHTMLAMDLSKFNNRAEIDNELKKTISSQAIRQFLMKNIQRNKLNTYAWRINVKVLANALPEIMGPVSLQKILNKRQITEIPILFVRGGKSDYLLPIHYQEIKQFFPNAQFETIPGAGHWLHVERPEELISLIHS